MIPSRTKLTVAAVLVLGSASWAAGPALWMLDRPRARLVEPDLPDPMGNIVLSTINGYFADAYGWSLPSVRSADAPGLYVVVGHPDNNPVVAELAASGVDLKLDELGNEGFRLVTHSEGARQFVIVTANTPVGLKHGCQELVFFRAPATRAGAAVDWPLDVTRKPAFPYRGVYMLPCWAAHDSFHHWRRVLEFHSELTINRNWFWLAGFPLLKQYGGPYEGTDLSDPWLVTGLVQICRAEGMKFYIGGGWFTWHHEQHADGSLDRGVQYYLDLLRLLPDAEGIYLEPAGEGRDTDEQIWRDRTQALEDLAETIWEERPEFEFAIAIGKFNAKPYREAIHALWETTGRHPLYWWWCWGDPIGDNALAEHPLMLRWHTIVRMSEFHGANAPPRPAERPLSGIVTSYDPGQGFGNPWNGWGALGADQPREFHPHTMPYFSHQYWYRERCWDVDITESAFAARLSRRLFDADMPDDAVHRYLELADLCPKPLEADPATLDALHGFVEQHADRGTPRNRDTFLRMREALDGIRAQHARSDNQE